ncbi:MAG: protein kinase [Sandaracinaceae bacterium]
MATSTASRTPGSTLAPGAVVGGRFAIERAVGEDPLGTLLAARDQKTGRPIAVRVLAPGLIATPEAVESLRKEVKAAAGIQQRNVVATYGMGADKASGSRYVATEWVDGQTLSTVIADKQDAAQPMSLRGAYNVVAHVCKALAAAEEKGTAHGALRPSVVWLTEAGRVKVANLGIDRAILSTVGPAALGPAEQPYLAPEVKAGGPPTPRSDVFGIGGLLYGMLTGRNAADPFANPSDVHPEANADVDAVLLKCLSADPAARFESPEEVKHALVSLTADTAPSHDEEDFGIDIDVDIDIGSVPPPGGEAPPVSVPGPAALPAGLTPPDAQPASAPEPAAPQLPPQPSLGFDPPPAAPVMSAEVDLGGLLAQITENDAPRWMVVKDNLDHGPFSGRELVQLILKGDVRGEHGLLNMDSGEKVKVGEAPEFIEFVEQWKLKKADADHEVALAQSNKVEKASNVGKIVIAALLAAALAVGAGVFLITRPDVETEARSDQEVADLYESGEIEISGSAGILPDPPARTGRRRRAGGGARGSLSYEDAMNQVVNLGSANGGGSQARLSPGQVAGVMNQNINRLVPCLSQGSGGGNVRIDMAIAGSGRVLGATVRNGTPGFKSCVAGRVRGIRFPSFPAARMGASYTFPAN